MKTSYFILAFICSLFLFSSCHDEDTPQEKHLTMVLQPDSIDGKDAMIWAGNPDWLYGSESFFKAEAWTWSSVPHAVRSLIEFDLTSIPTTATVDSASLSLYSDPTLDASDESAHYGLNESVLRRITENWVEDSVTWNNQPKTTSTNEIVLEKSLSSCQDYTDIDITQHVQEWVSDPSSNMGFMIQLSTEEPYRIMSFASSDHANSSIRPKLIVYYTVWE